MNASVEFNEEGDPYRMEVSEGRHGHSASFAIRGSSAIAQSIEPADGESRAYIDELSRFMEYAETLPFIQAVDLEDPEVLE